MAAKFNITVVEGFQWLLKKLEFNLGEAVIPDEGKLEILTQRMRADRDQKLRDLHAALKAEYEICDPDPDKMGSLEIAQAKLAKRNQQGEEWGAELSADTPPSEARAGELNRRLAACSAEIGTLEAEIVTLKRLYDTRRATTADRRRLYEDAKTETAKLEKIAPAVLAQTKALKDAQRERMEAAKARASGVKSQAGAILAAFEQELSEAQAGESAAASIELDETNHENIDLDAIAEHDEARSAADERIARWTKKREPVGA